MKIQYFISENLLFWKYWKFWLTGGTYILRYRDLRLYRVVYTFLCRCTYMLHHVKLPYSCDEGEKNDIVIGFSQKHIRWLLLSDEDMHEVLLPLPVVGAHEVGNCINIVTYCVIISVGLLSAGRANLSVEMHFKVLLCYDQENILLQMYLYRCEFCFC